jgi:hypothetical protein
VQKPEVSESMIYAAMVRLMLHRLAGLVLPQLSNPVFIFTL